jgi:hypothetical protein
VKKEEESEERGKRETERGGRERERERDSCEEGAENNERFVAISGE